MRFRKSIRLGKGLKLNLSKSGVSVTVGTGKGVSLNLGKKGRFSELEHSGHGAV